MDIEKRLLKRKVPINSLNEFASMSKNPGKKNIFLELVCLGILNPDERKNNLVNNMAEILYRIGIATDEFNPLGKRNGQCRFLGKEKYKMFVVGQMALKMYKTLKKTKYKQYDQTFTLNKIYNDTFCV